MRQVGQLRLFSVSLRAMFYFLKLKRVGCYVQLCRLYIQFLLFKFSLNNGFQSFTGFSLLFSFSYIDFLFSGHFLPIFLTNNGELFSLKNWFLAIAFKLL